MGIAEQVPVSSPAGPHGARRPGLGGAVVRIAGSLVRLVWAVSAAAAYWAWGHYRATAAFRRALRQAGLPPEAVARLTQRYGSVGPLQLLRQVLARRG